MELLHSAVVLDIQKQYIASGQYSLERQTNKESLFEELCYVKIFNNIAIAEINSNCTLANNITKGIKFCNQRYYIYYNKINNTWIKNETTKHIVW